MKPVQLPHKFTDSRKNTRRGFVRFCVGSIIILPSTLGAFCFKVQNVSFLGVFGMSWRFSQLLIGVGPLLFTRVTTGEILSWTGDSANNRHGLLFSWAIYISGTMRRLLVRVN